MTEAMCTQSYSEMFAHVIPFRSIIGGADRKQYVLLYSP